MSKARGRAKQQVIEEEQEEQVEEVQQIEEEQQEEQENVDQRTGAIPVTTLEVNTIHVSELITKREMGLRLQISKNL